MKLNYAKQSGDTAAINEMFDSRIICCLEPRTCFACPFHCAALILNLCSFNRVAAGHKMPQLGSHFARSHQMGFLHRDGPEFSPFSPEKQGKANDGTKNVRLGMLLSTFRHRSV